MFRAPYWLAAGLLILPAAWGLLAWARARRARVTDALGRAATLARVCEPARRFDGLRLGALAFLLVALAGPQFGVELVETRTDARQAVIAVDVSLSMMTPDVRPTRLERAKSSLSLLIDQLRGERVGVVAFAGEAQTICPLTQDSDAAKQLLGALEVGAIPTPGTSLGGALRAATAMLGRYPGGKAVILLTDGEDHKSDPLGAAKEAAAAGVRVYTVGIGTPDGEPIPGENGTYHKDAKGVTVVSRLDEKTLADIAKETGGAYYRTTPGSDEIADIARRVRELDAAKGLTGSTNLWRDRFAWPASLAFLLLLVELVLSCGFARKARESVKPAVLAAAALAALVAAPSRAAASESILREGNHLYKMEQYEAALERYGAAAAKAPKDPRPAFNSGAALYKLDKPGDAAEFFSTVAARKDLDSALRSDAYYNLGDARFKTEELPAAAAAFRAALALSPGDAAARHNLAVTIKRIKSPPPPQRPKGGEKNKDEPKKPDDKQQAPKSNGGDKDPKKNQTKTRPQDQLTKDEAERILRAVNEREKQTQKQVQEGKGRRVQGKPPAGEDW